MCSGLAIRRPKGRLGSGPSIRKDASSSLSVEIRSITNLPSRISVLNLMKIQTGSRISNISNVCHLLTHRETFILKKKL